MGRRIFFPSCIAIALVVVTATKTLAATAFNSTFNYPGGFHIYGHEPVPQVDGFDYFFTPDCPFAQFAKMRGNFRIDQKGVWLPWHPAEMIARN